MKKSKIFLNTLLATSSIGLVTTPILTLTSCSNNEKDQIPEKANNDFDTISYPLMEMGFDMNQYFSVHTYTQKEWDNMSFLPFHKNVERDKIVLV